MAKTAKSKVKGMLNSALKKHEMQETDYGRQFIDLPPGINNGIAKLIDAKIGEYKPGTTSAGQPFLYLAGAVVEPKQASFVPKVFQDGKIQNLPAQTLDIEGQRTTCGKNKTLPLCETTNADGTVVTVGENVDTAFMELQKLGLDPSTIPDSDDPEKELSDLLALAVEEELIFKFSTSASDPNENYPNTRVWENWHGNRGLDDYEESEEDGVVDGSEEKVDEEPETEEKIEAGEDTYQTGDGEKGDAGDREAQVRLTTTAEENGINPDELPNWGGVETAILEAIGEDDDNDEAPPEKGDEFGYKPPRKRKPVACEVTVVFAGKQTVNLKNLDSGASYKGISWDKLVELE